ncbi:hypothetical protein PR048_033278 [Dryococelus australis]|uniref:Uncharacterized protein n=1 Tax=Dryococelus australis TaxID=614101 RepID=A0ABQ9G143_9NEOP|nr:hypothetical protein PR048_033278 [Dryococelus australis]
MWPFSPRPRQLPTPLLRPRPEFVPRVRECLPTSLLRFPRPSDKICVKHVLTEANFVIGSQFIRHALDNSEPIADWKGNTWSNTGHSLGKQPMDIQLRQGYAQDCGGCSTAAAFAPRPMPVGTLLRPEGICRPVRRMFAVRVAGARRVNVLLLCGDVLFARIVSPSCFPPRSHTQQYGLKVGAKQLPMEHCTRLYNRARRFTRCHTKFGSRPPRDLGVTFPRGGGGEIGSVEPRARKRRTGRGQSGGREGRLRTARAQGHPDAGELPAIISALVQAVHVQAVHFQPARLTPSRTGFDPRPRCSRIFVRGNRAGRCRWSGGFSRGPPVSPPPSHSGAASYSSHLTLIGSEHPDVKSHPNLFTRSFYYRLFALGVELSPDKDTWPITKGKPHACYRSLESIFRKNLFREKHVAPLIGKRSTARTLASLFEASSLKGDGALDARNGHSVTTETLHVMRVGATRHWACVQLSPVSLLRFLTADARVHPTLEQSRMSNRSQSPATATPVEELLSVVFYVSMGKLRRKGGGGGLSMALNNAVARIVPSRFHNQIIPVFLPAAITRSVRGDLINTGKMPWNILALRNISCASTSPRGVREHGRRNCVAVPLTCACPFSNWPRQAPKFANASSRLARVRDGDTGCRVATVVSRPSQRGALSISPNAAAALRNGRNLPVVQLRPMMSLRVFYRDRWRDQPGGYRATGCAIPCSVLARFSSSHLPDEVKDVGRGPRDRLADGRLTDVTDDCESTLSDKLDFQHVYTEVSFPIGTQFIRHALGNSEPIAYLRRKHVSSAVLPGVE